MRIADLKVHKLGCAWKSELVTAGGLMVGMEVELHVEARVGIAVRAVGWIEDH